MPQPHLGRENDREAAMISLQLTGRKYSSVSGTLHRPHLEHLFERVLYRNAPLSVETSNHPKKVFDFTHNRRISF